MEDIGRGWEQMNFINDIFRLSKISVVRTVAKLNDDEVLLFADVYRSGESLQEYKRFVLNFEKRGI